MIETEIVRITGYRPMPASSRVIVLRGDLYSDTGYARATRALGHILAGQAAKMFAISLHEHRARRQTAIDFPLVNEAELRTNPAFRDALVVNVCLPDFFIRVPGAVNIGYFFWETDCLPPSRFWKSQMLKMDRLWAPSRWQRDIFQDFSDGAEIAIVPWPMVEEPALAPSEIAALAKVRVHAPMTNGELDNYLMRASPPDCRGLEKELEEAEHASGRSARFESDRSMTFGTLIESEGDLFVAVQTDAPRKGLPLLLANWLQFKARAAGRNAKLVIKMSSLDVSADLFRIHFHVSLAIEKARRRCRVDAPDVFVIHDRLSSGQMRALLARADAFVSATLGEGFGGPIAEALIEGTPVIAPRHTSIQDILDADYPLSVASVPHHLKLWKNIDVYSAASRWHVVDDASFVACLEALALMPHERRRAVAEEARSSLLTRTGRAAVAETLQRELAICDGLTRSAGHFVAAAPGALSLSRH